MDTPYQDRVLHENRWTFGPDPRAPSFRKRKLTDPWDEIRRAQRVELQEDVDFLSANYAKPQDYSADDDISRIDVHEMAYQAEVSTSMTTRTSRCMRAAVFFQHFGKQFFLRYNVATDGSSGCSSSLN
eukprot:8606817-Pyramimonas_sp.AAC.1